MSKQGRIVRVSPKFQVVIPSEVREAAGIEPGMEFEMVAMSGGLKLIRLYSLRDLRGIATADVDVAVRRPSREVT